VPDLPFPASAPEAARFIRAGTAFQQIGNASRPEALSLKLKRAIDRSPLRQIAEHAGGLGISHAQLTRAFKRDYLITPVEYRSALKVEEGILKLLEGRSAIEACHEAGFSDLSRFNRTMKKVTTVPPSRFSTKTALLRSSPREPR
jgi:AraC-like DNA-binding protein